jgi:hypothetical protein
VFEEAIRLVLAKRDIKRKISVTSKDSLKKSRAEEEVKMDSDKSCQLL